MISLPMYVPAEPITGDFATAATATDGRMPLCSYSSSYSHRRQNAALQLQQQLQQLQPPTE